MCRQVKTWVRMARPPKIKEIMTKSLGGQPPKFKKPDEMLVLITEYFDACNAEKRRTTKPGLAMALGFESRQSLHHYKNKSPDFCYLIKKAEQLIEDNLCQLDSAMAIFQLKAYYNVNEGGTEEEGYESDGYDEEMAKATKAAFK